MTPEQWQRIEELFHSALKHKPEERSAFLDHACSNDHELRREVEALIAPYDETRSSLATPLRSDALRVVAEGLPAEFDRTGLLSGDLVLNRYKIISSLGRGGMGEVYEVMDQESQRRVALKTLRLGSENDPSALYRFKQEFRVLADIYHPNLIKLYDLISDGQRWFFTMELVDGADFLRFVRPADKLDEARLRDVLAQVAEALEVLHRAGKLHLDIKPSNVLVTRDGSVRLIDFGLAKELLHSALTQTLSFMGTPAYMAPEQGRGAPVSEASDWYSVGTMLYEALTGRLPFTGSAFEIYRQKMDQEPIPPCSLASGVLDDLSVLCIELLRRDAAARPSSDDVVRRLTHRLEHQEQRTGHDKIRELPFVGREPELKVLWQAYSDSRAGRPVLVFISGDSGIGKTALTQRFSHKLEQTERDVVVLSGRCYERESVPFKGLDSLIDRLSQYLRRLPTLEVTALLPRDVQALVRLFPVLRRVEAIAAAPAPISISDAREVRLRGFGGLRELLARLADRRGVVICIDDMQWADGDSFALLNEVIAHPHAPSALFVLCHRDEETDATQYLQALSTPAAYYDLRHLRIVELSYQESLELAERLLGTHETLPEMLLERIAHEAGGIPFFVDQLAQFAGPPWVQHDQPVPSTAIPEPVLPNFVSLMESRLQRLPKPASDLLNFLALAGQPLTLEQIRGAAGFDIHDYDALPTLRSKKLIRARQRRDRVELEPYHDRIREVVVGNMSLEDQRRCHLALAAAFERTGDSDPEAVAHHFEAAGERPKAASYAELAAARAAAGLAFDRAARLYGIALQHCSESGAHDRELRVKMAEALANAGRGPEAAQQYLHAAGESAGIEALQFQQRAAEQMMRTGHLDEGLELLRRLSTSVGLRLATGRRALLPSVMFRRAHLWLRGLQYHAREASTIDRHELLRIDICWSIGLGWSLVDTLRGAEAQALHLLLALKSGEPHRIALALAAEAGYATVRGKRSLRRVPQLLEMAVQTAERIDNPHALGLATFSAGMQAWVRADFLRSFELCEQAEQIYRTRCTGVAWEIETSQIFALACLAWMGRLKELSERLPPLHRDAQKRGDRYAAASFVLLTRFWLVHLAADAPEVAEQEAAAAINEWPRQEYYLQHYWALLCRFETALYRGEPATATGLVQQQWRLLSRSLLPTYGMGTFLILELRARSLLAAATIARSDHRRRNQLLRELQRDVQRIKRQEMLSSAPMAELLQAGSARVLENSEAAIGLYAAAEKGFEAANMQLYAAVARRRRGELTGGEEGRALISSADCLMQLQGVKNPSRLAATLAPG